MATSEKTMKSIPVLLSVLAAAIFASCSREDKVAPRALDDQNRSTRQAAPQKPPVVPSVQENQNWAILAKTDFFQGIWQPSESVVSHAIHDARQYLEKLKKTTSSDDERKKIGEILAGWDKYLCQVVGHTKNGKKLIHLNFFPKRTIAEDLGKDWRRRYIMVDDGGAEVGNSSIRKRRCGPGIGRDR